jgi:WD40 repeat protein
MKNIFKKNYVFTGSVDRTIKVWDTDPKKKAVVQTIVGHNGTVLDIKYS